MEAHIARLLCLSAMAFAVPSANAAGWKAGAATVDITPELPAWMAGYGNRDRPGDAIAHPIFAKAVALEDERQRVVVIVTADVLGLPRLVRESVERRIAEAFGLSAAQLLLNASHTHTGPEIRVVETTFGREDQGRLERVLKYRAELEAKLFRVISDALAARQPANLAFGRATAGFAMNRREDYTLPEGHPRRGRAPNPNGPVDHDVPVLRITDSTGRLSAVLFGYACHNTTLDGYAITGDYAGFAQDFVQEAHPGAVALFIQGCAGDQNPHPRRDMVKGLTPLELARQHGRTLALAVEAALASFPQPLGPRLESVLEYVDLDYQPPPTRAELETRAKSVNRTERENAQVLLEWLQRDGKLPSTYRYPIQLLRFGGELTFVALASEVVVDYSLRLKREFGNRAIWVAGYCNDFLGYIPSRRVLQEGGYEGGGSMVFGSTTLYRGAAHPNLWAPTIEDAIVHKVLTLDQHLGARP